MKLQELPVPPQFSPDTVEQVWKIDYQKIAESARKWAEEHKIHPADEDTFRMALLLVDCQNTFCTPGYELFVAGRSGTAAVKDSGRICRFIYRNPRGVAGGRAALSGERPGRAVHGVQPLCLVWALYAAPGALAAARVDPVPNLV